MPELVLRRRYTPLLLLLLFAHIADHLTSNRQVARFAYVDPGAGLLALQIAGASVMGAFYLVWRKLQSLFSRPKREHTTGDTQRQTN